MVDILACLDKMPIGGMFDQLVSIKKKKKCHDKKDMGIELRMELSVLFHKVELRIV